MAFSFVKLYEDFMFCWNNYKAQKISTLNNL